MERRVRYYRLALMAVVLVVVGVALVGATGDKDTIQYETKVIRVEGIKDKSIMERLEKALNKHPYYQVKTMFSDPRTCFFVLQKEKAVR